MRSPIVCFSCALLAVSVARGQDFEVSTFVEGLDRPVAMAVAPDGRVFVTEQGGQVRIVDETGLVAEPFIELEVLDEGESGLLGIALDPNFADNGYVYVFASVSEEEQHILRYTDNGGQGVDPAVIRVGLPTNGRFHNGGALKFGPDGMLYFSVGDTGEPDAAQSMTTLAGKICRINPDGSVPEDNPFTTPTGAPRAIYAMGFRNPFRMSFAPDGRLFVADVGSTGTQRREEINIVYPGENYGWPIVEGFGDEADSEFSDPLFAYNELGQAATGVAYYSGDQFPARYRGNLFQLDFVLNRLFRLVLDGDMLVSDELLLDIGGAPVDLIEDLDGTLLVTELFTGRISRITYVGLPDDPNDPNLMQDPNMSEESNALTGGTDELTDGVVVPVPCGLPLMIGLMGLTLLSRRGC
jgi:glucose/arabinose dehydrogenase